MKKLNRRILACLLIFGLIYISYDVLLRVKPANSQINESLPDVTVFVHGYKGTAVSFRSMLERFEQTYEWGKKALTCRVTADGRVLVDETADFQTEERLFVQVVFENNRASFHDSAYWLSKVLNVLHETYQVETVNIVGHSMGGIVSVKFLEDYSKGPGYPFINKLVVLGSPFSGLKNKDYLKTNTGPAAVDLMPRSAALQKLFKQKHAFPSDVQVLALAGSGDQLVSVKSALSLDQIVPASQFQQAVVSDRRITHSGLHESEEVDRIIGRFLWNE
ncbi:alpha/beta hydrolase [Bacillus aerolatus]|uniref:alpha/beta hydrolase n=1 Tax=Bacillus aerolatus TaxID=2653354 RepID=UPI0017859EEC|nr:alpha/beta hydrolase [Bacillus aerolatus]